MAARSSSSITSSTNSYKVSKRRKASKCTTGTWRVLTSSSDFTWVNQLQRCSKLSKTALRSCGNINHWLRLQMSTSSVGQSRPWFPSSPSSQLKWVACPISSRATLNSSATTITKPSECEFVRQRVATRLARCQEKLFIWALIWIKEIRSSRHLLALKLWVIVLRHTTLRQVWWRGGLLKRAILQKTNSK